MTIREALRLAEARLEQAGVPDADADARPSTGGNAAYALLCALGVTAVTFGLHENAAKALLFGAAAFILCFALLSLLMAYVKKRQKQQSDELDDE